MAPALTFTPPPRRFCGVYLPPLGHRQHPSFFFASSAPLPKCFAEGGDTEEQLGIRNSGYFQSWKFTVGINGITWALVGINGKFAKLQASLNIVVVGKKRL